MRKLAVGLAVLALFISERSDSQSEAIQIFGGDNHDVYLGCLNCSEFDSNSVANQFGKYGWGSVGGAWNHFGNYADSYGNNSACNEYARKPPALVDRHGAFYGYLSVNEYLSNSICAIGGNEGVCSALKRMCASD